MRKVREANWGKKVLMGILSLVFVLALGVMADPLAITSYAQSESKVIARSAKIRKDASTSSEVLGSAEKDAKLTINGKLQGSDGATWYQVFVDADTLGYIRSDLVEITDGSTPQTITGTSTGTATTTEPPTEPEQNTTEVTPVEPVSATANSNSVRVRANASTGSQIVATTQNGLAMTVTGTATSTDGKTWYQVNFISNDAEITGFIRSDFVNLQGELTAPVEEPVVEPEVPAEESVEEPEIVKDWDTQLDGEKWYLVNNVEQKRYEVQQFFDLEKSAAQLQQMYETEQDKNKSQKVVVIILVVVMIAMAAVITMLVFKVKDMTDAAYFAEVERENARRRVADRPNNSGQKINRAPESGRRPVGNGTRPAGARPSGTGTRPVGARPAASRPAAATTNQNGRPAAARPATAANGTASRPMASANGQAVTRPAGTRPAAPAGTRPAASGQPVSRPATSANGQATRPATGSQQTARPAQNPVRTTRPVNQGEMRPLNAPAAQNAAKAPRKPGNYKNGDDEFEFEFLNWDGDEE